MSIFEKLWQKCARMHERVKIIFRTFLIQCSNHLIAMMILHYNMLEIICFGYINFYDHEHVLSS